MKFQAAVRLGWTLDFGDGVVDKYRSATMQSNRIIYLGYHPATARPM